MNQPLPVADEVGVGGRYGEIVHQLTVVAEFNRFDKAGSAVGPLNLAANFQDGRRYPIAIGQTEGMFRRCFNRSTIYGQVNNKRVFVNPGGQFLRC
jgi:hypothetical protein